MNNAKAAILQRIERALGPQTAPPPQVPRHYRQQTGHHDLLELFIERVSDYRATVVVTAAEALPALLAQIITEHGIDCLAIPHDLPLAWRVAPQHLLDHPNLSIAALEQAQAVLTACAGAVAETGTIVLDHSQAQGRRVLTLLPDIHICVVQQSQIVDNLPALTGTLVASVANKCPLTFISGPSATSDIELSRVEGVHGPRTLIVVVVIGV
jgi:L-lactate dehydrogenase complex protein LldG